MTRTQKIIQALNAAGFRPIPTRSRKYLRFHPVPFAAAPGADPEKLAGETPRVGAYAAIGEAYLRRSAEAGATFWVGKRGGFRFGNTISDSYPVLPLTTLYVEVFGEFAKTA